MWVNVFLQAITTDPSLRRAASANSIDEPSQTTRPILTRGPSVYQGAEEKVIAEVTHTCTEINNARRALTGSISAADSLLCVHVLVNNPKDE